MATKQPEVNKSEKIRELLREAGASASPTEIAKKLKGQGIRVTANAVSVIKGKFFKKAAARNLAVDDVVAVSDLAKKIGVENLKRVAEVLGS